MESLEQQFASLTPEQRQLVELWLHRQDDEESAPLSASNQIPRRASNGASPLSFAQQRLWFLNRLEPGNSAYNFRVVIRLTGKLDAATLERSLNVIVQRHEVLRTTFHAEDGQPRQTAAPTLHLSLPLVELGHVPLDERDDQVQQQVSQAIEQPFDLEQGPLLRARLLRLDAEDHVLILVLHHSVADGWSSGILLRELTTLYTVFTEGQPSPLPELPIQYADYAAWQRERLQGEVLEEQLAYWKDCLEGAPRALDLPTDRPRPPIATYHGAVHHFALPASLVEQLKELGRREGVTLFMTLLAAFDVLLYRYSGQVDLVVGSPIAGRNRNELEGLIGCFMNMLVLRVDLSGDPAFTELLQRVREVTLGGYAHQELPFEKLVEALQPARDLSRHPLFQVLFALQNAQLPSLKRPGLTITPMEMSNKTSRFDLAVFLREIGPDIDGGLEYNTDLFDAASIERLVTHFITLLEGILAQPRRRLSELPLMTAGERDRLLLEWNATRSAYPDEECVHQLFETQAERAPEAVAVSFGDQHLSYFELNRRANQLAHLLQLAGAGPESRVAICMERSPEVLIGLLGILKAGAAYLPLDPTYPEQRLAFMLQDSQTPLLLTHTACLDLLPAHSARVICLDADWRTVAHHCAENPTSAVQPDNLAYIIYTSGSTGKPKGVQIPHRAVVNFLQSMRRSPGIDPQDALLAVTTLAFDIAALELFLPLSAGARLILADRTTALHGPDLLATLKASRATMMQATPITWRLLLAAGWDGDPPLTVLCGGEALSRDLADQLLHCSPQVWNLYGPTETTIWSCIARLEAGQGAPPIGRPIANTEVYILDEQCQPAPIGVPGELYIGGDGVARGYLNRPDLTAERFVPTPPFPPPSKTGGDTGGGRRLYRTGDLARWSANGVLEFLSRVDHQVKVRGHRIELGEIEALLRQYPQVTEALVVVHERADVLADKSLVAYVAVDAEQEPLAGDLRRFLQSQLPNYMLPSAFVFLRALPRLPNGKVDRRALPAPALDKPKLEVSYAAPHSDAEKQIAQIVQDLLHVDRIGLNDNFFDLGGHSLLLVQLQSRLQTLFGREVPVVQLFRHSTVRDLARYFSQTVEEKPAFAQLEERGRKHRAVLQRRARPQRP